LGDLDSVKDFSQRIIMKYVKVDILVNNGGMAGPDLRCTSKQGWETTLTVNYLGHYLLTQNLLPLIKESKNGRIVNVASAAYEFFNIDIGDL